MHLPERGPTRSVALAAVLRLLRRAGCEWPKVAQLNSGNAPVASRVFLHWSNGISMVLLAHVVLKPSNFTTFALVPWRFCNISFCYDATDFHWSVTVDFVQIAISKNDSKTCLKSIILSFWRLHHNQNINFYTGFVNFFGIVNFHNIDLF